MSEKGPLKLGAIHPLTGRQWELGKEDTWPDLEIVLPFNRRVTDNTATIIGPAVSAESVGGYDTLHSLNKVEVYDLIHNRVVPNVKGVWAAGPAGDTSRIHLLGDNPFSWLVPHGDTISTAFEDPGRVVEQSFGQGEAEVFTDERRFGEVLVKPAASADLITLFHPPLPTRVMKSSNFVLRFRTLYGAPIYIDQLALVILGRDVGGGQGPSFTIAEGGSVTQTFVGPVLGDVSLIYASVALSSPVDHVGVDSPKGVPLLVYRIRYREARKRVVVWGEKAILVPGRYRITVEGESKGTSSVGLPPTKTVKWRVIKEFGVKYPETLRPYIIYSTVGDDRIFFTEPLPPPPSILSWNPTLQGVGFPAYRKYLPVVRFLVPYMSTIFPTIKMKVAYEKGSPPSVLTDDVAPIPNPDGDSSLPQKSKDWVVAAGGSVAPDQEIIFTKALPQEGMAKVVLSFALPTGEEAKLDEWSCYFSKFDSFSQHVAWGGKCLQVYYDSAGRHVVPSCPIISPFVIVTLKRTGNRMEALPEAATYRLEPAFEASKVLLLGAAASEGVQPYPDELTSVPLDWRLPSSLLEGLAALDQQTGVRFARFAQDTGVRFNEGGGDKLDGIQDTVETCTVEAVVDSQKRPYALWLRTAEPVDWRRISGTLKINHVEQTGVCPTAYAHRLPMDLTIDILPSPDATSAFLVGSFAGTTTLLPRGEYELTLFFDPYRAGLPKLRPGLGVGSVPEQAKMKFIQPFGLDWSLPSTGVVIPAGLLERVIEVLHLPGPGPDPEKIFRLYEDYVRSERAVAARPQVMTALQISSQARPSEGKPLDSKPRVTSAEAAKPGAAAVVRGSNPSNTVAQAGISERRKTKGAPKEARNR